ncbi:MAG: GtrA family protein [Bacteroidales bacterium]|nr:GtrA family protein [Bacteroidales bacterium]
MSALKNIEHWFERILTTAIDFFYPPFRKLLSLELFRYAACGGMNLVLEWVLYYVFYHFVFQGQVFDLGQLLFNRNIAYLTFTPHIAAFIFKFPITFLTGFWMARHISFSSSTLRGRTQIVRYLLVTIGNILINYLGLKLFVEVLHIWPTISYVIISIICVAFSYLSNKFYSFKKEKKENKA